MRFFLHLLLHGVILGHCVRISSCANTEEIKLSALIRGQDASITILSPVFSPRIFNDPEFLTISLLVPANNLDDMLSIKAESIFGAVIDSLLVGQEVSVDDHLSDNGTIFQEFLLDSSVVLRKAVVNNLVENTVLSALVRFEVIVNVASSFSTSEGIASLRNKALALAPIESTSDISTLTSVVALITADDLLG